MDATIHVDQQIPAASSVNWMPFGIAHDGPCNAAEYFTPTQEQDVGPSQSSDNSNSSTHFAAHFRGRRLKGTPKQLPEGYQGLLLQPAGGAKHGSSSSDTQQRSWKALQRFQQITVWNHDTLPAASDWHMRCIDFLALADKVHAPIDPSQVEQELQRMQQQQ
uniref:Uncharacterized protein n=1 Tax=Tetradesmus obliquus TaxID=3088 RepID=A0A383V873_TETOB|eukprot:jgi/Sobl393_1/3483/SZX60972.1